MKLYVLISNGGDGSYYPNYTLRDDLIEAMQDAYNADLFDYDSLGCDGDGFHYDTIIVPDGSTRESLDINLIEDDPEDLAYYLNLTNEDQEDD